jgi:hypothetical protein
MREYRFLTTWLIEAPREDVFQAIWDSDRWPEWWRGVEKVVELEPGDAEGVGALYSLTWKSRLPYRLTFDMRTERVERPFLIHGVAKGELQGTGTWRIYNEGDLTAAVYEWNVVTTERWMNALAPVAHSIFSWNHDYVMRNGGRGLAKLLNTKLVATS